MVTVRDSREREISQGSSVGITEFAPGNIVYVAGEKIRVERIVFRGGAQRRPAAKRRRLPLLHHLRLCERPHPRHPASALSRRPCAQQTLRRLRGGQRRKIDVITQDDEYRSREDYATHTYLKARDKAPSPQDGVRVFAEWRLAYSRRRQIELYNRGLRDHATGMAQPFVVCLECGAWHHPRGDEESGTVSTVSTASLASGHLPSCTVTTDAQADPRIAVNLHLRAHLQGEDVIEMPLPAEVGDDAALDREFCPGAQAGHAVGVFRGR